MAGLAPARTLEEPVPEPYNPSNIDLLNNKLSGASSRSNLSQLRAQVAAYDAEYGAFEKRRSQEALQKQSLTSVKEERVPSYSRLTSSQPIIQEQVQPSAPPLVHRKTSDAGTAKSQGSALEAALR